MKTKSYSYSERKGYLAINWEHFHRIVNGLAINIKDQPDAIIGISRGGLYPATLLSHILQSELIPIKLGRRVKDVVVYKSPKWVIKPSMKNIKDRNVLIVDEICDSGETLNIVKESIKKLGAKKIKTLVLYSHTRSSNIPDYIGIITDELILNPWDRVIMENGTLTRNKEYLEAFEMQKLNKEDFAYNIETNVPDKS